MEVILFTFLIERCGHNGMGRFPIAGTRVSRGLDACSNAQPSLLIPELLIYFAIFPFSFKIFRLFVLSLSLNLLRVLPFQKSFTPVTSFPLVSRFLSPFVSFSCILAVLRVVGE